MNRTIKKLAWLFCAALIVLTATVPTAAEPEKRLRTASFDGVGVSYLDEGPGDALPVVFIHGWACTGDFWRFQTSALRSPGTGPAGRLSGNARNPRRRPSGG